MRVLSGHRGKMRFIFKAGYRIIRLWLQERRFDAPFAGGQQRRHAPPIQQVGHKRGDKNCLARARKPRHTQPDHRLEKRFRHRVLHRFDLTPNTIGNT